MWPVCSRLIGAGKEAVLEYEVLDSGVWDMYHTEVPEEYRGQGLAGQLAKVGSSHTLKHMHSRTHSLKLNHWNSITGGGACKQRCLKHYATISQYPTHYYGSISWKDS